MNYQAKKIFLTCSENTVREWAAFMNRHKNEVAQSLLQEGVRHEMWLMGRNQNQLYIIGVMDVDDRTASSKIAKQSMLSVDKVHREFKTHWDRSKMEDLKIDPLRPPNFAECELLIDVRQSA